ncbi:hypothetical protein BAE44_0010881, partial [Dichanthelium oligosanthes]
LVVSCSVQENLVPSMRRGHHTTNTVQLSHLGSQGRASEPTALQHQPR